MSFFLKKDGTSLNNVGFYSIFIILLVVALLWSVTMINPGEVGVLVNLLGPRQGVNDKELNIGIHFIYPWEKIYTFPIFEQNHQWTDEEAFVFQTSEGLSVNADIGISFNLLPNRIHELFSKYRRGMEEITHIFIRNNIRDAINRHASKMKIEDLYGPEKENFFINVRRDVQKELEPLGFHISHVFIIGRFQVPDAVLDALNKKIEAIQRAQQRENELREAEAMARKNVAIVRGESEAKLLKAQAESKANEIISKSLTKELLQWEATVKWDGKLPSVISGSEMPFLLQLKN